MAQQSIFDMKVSKIYPRLFQKVECKSRSKEEGELAKGKQLARCWNE